MAISHHLRHRGRDQFRPARAGHRAAAVRRSWPPVAVPGAMVSCRLPLAQRRTVGLPTGRPPSRLLRLAHRVGCRSVPTRGWLQQQSRLAAPSQGREGLVYVTRVDGCDLVDTLMQPCAVVDSTTLRLRPRRGGPSPQAQLATRGSGGFLRRACRGPWWPLAASAHCGARSAWVGSLCPFVLGQPTLVESSSAWRCSTLPSRYAGLHCAEREHPGRRLAPSGGTLGTSPVASHQRSRRPMGSSPGVGTHPQEMQEWREEETGGGGWGEGTEGTGDGGRRAQGKKGKLGWTAVGGHVSAEGQAGLGWWWLGREGRGRGRIRYRGRSREGPWSSLEAAAVG